jgi:hypothetical protein
MLCTPWEAARFHPPHHVGVSADTFQHGAVCWIQRHVVTRSTYAGIIGQVHRGELVSADEEGCRRGFQGVLD